MRKKESLTKGCTVVGLEGDALMLSEVVEICDQGSNISRILFTLKFVHLVVVV